MAVMDTQGLLDIKQEIVDSKQESAKLQGKAEEIERRIKEDLKYKTFKHAKRDIGKQTKKLQELKELFTLKSDSIKKTYEELGI